MPVGRDEQHVDAFREEVITAMRGAADVHCRGFESDVQSEYGLEFQDPYRRMRQDDPLLFEFIDSAYQPPSRESWFAAKRKFLRPVFQGGDAHHFVQRDLRAATPRPQDSLPPEPIRDFTGKQQA
jgi:hypothetical protein